MEPGMTRYIVDTNILIYYLAGSLPPGQEPAVDRIYHSSFIPTPTSCTGQYPASAIFDESEVQ